MDEAIVVCSGGIDSVVTAYYVKKKLKFNSITILFFNYGQKTVDMERKMSRKCARNIKAKFIEISMKDVGKISNSLINKKGKTTRLKRTDLKDTKEESKKWYVPCRNLIFLSYASALAESISVKGDKSEIFVGFKNEGKESFPDTTQEFLDKLNKLNLSSTIGKFKIRAPLIMKDKEDIINLGDKFDVDFRDTFSCYIGKYKHCGHCLACKLRQEGFYWANIKDPTIY